MRCPPQAEIFYVSSDDILLKLSFLVNFIDDLDPEFLKFSPVAAFSFHFFSRNAIFIKQLIFDFFQGMQFSLSNPIFSASSILRNSTRARTGKY